MKIIISILAFSSIFYTAIVFSVDNEHAANSQLSSMKDDIEVYSLLLGNENNSEARNRLSLSILKKLILVRTLNPKIKNLNGNSLETLCFLTQKEGLEILNSADSKGLKDLGVMYINSIEDELMGVISNHQEVRRGKGCSIGPKN